MLVTHDKNKFSPSRTLKLWLFKYSYLYTPAKCSTHTRRHCPRALAPSRGWRKPWWRSQAKSRTPQCSIWCPHGPHKVRADCKAHDNEIKLYCFSVWKIPISVSCDSSLKPKPPVLNQMTESRGKLLLKQQKVTSRHAHTPAPKPDLSRQRKYFLKTPKKP